MNKKFITLLATVLFVSSCMGMAVSADETEGIEASSEVETYLLEDGSEEPLSEDESDSESVFASETQGESGQEEQQIEILEEAPVEFQEETEEAPQEAPIQVTDEIRADINYGTGVDGFVQRCYEIALNRQPDPTGLSNWKNMLYLNQACGVSVAFGFVYSPEFQNAGFDNEVYVTKMYNLFLGREPDAGGKQYWIDKLNGGESREEIFAGFANSVEFYNLCNSYGIVSGTYIKGIGMERNANINGFVTRLYNLCLSRNGDMGGQSMWVSGLANGTITGAEVAHGFIFSKEFINLGYSNYDFVATLYKAFFDREGNISEITSWSIDISNNYSTKERVFDGFANSQEFTNICNSYGIVRGQSDYGKPRYASNRDHGTLSGFEYLYELEDIIGAKYDVTIHIADEVPYRVLTMCDMDSCYDYDVIREALIAIDKAYSVYPDDFFKQFTYGRIKEFNIYISGSGDAAAFTNYSDYASERYICYDAYSITSYEGTIDHEISHCIEQVVLYNSDSFDEDEWNAMNPEGFEYMNSYSGRSPYNGNEDYFVSEYSTTYVEEDRAELFETAMVYYWYYSGQEIDLPDPIEAKLSYYFNAIRETFDTSSWSIVEPWEEILNK